LHEGNKSQHEASNASEFLQQILQQVESIKKNRPFNHMIEDSIAIEDNVKYLFGLIGSNVKA